MEKKSKETSPEIKNKITHEIDDLKVLIKILLIALKLKIELFCFKINLILKKLNLRLKKTLKLK